MDSLNLGHRKRLLEKFTQAGTEGLHNYEIVELLLSFIIQRKDTKAPAKELIQKYKTINNILYADPSDIGNIKGIGEKTSHFFTFLQQLFTYCLNERFIKKEIISHRKDVEQYLRFHFGVRKDEYFAVIFLNNSNQILSVDEIAEGTVNQCVVYPRAILERAIKYGSSSIIISHNHPGGSSEASESDWEITRRILQVCSIMNISLLDHLIITKENVFSLRDKSRWQQLSSIS